MADPRKTFLLRYIKEPKLYNNTHIRRTNRLEASLISSCRSTALIQGKRSMNSLF